MTDIISEDEGKRNVYFAISEEHCQIIPNFTCFPLWGIVHLISEEKKETMWTFMYIRKVYYKYIPLRFIEVKNSNQGAICSRYPVMQLP